MVGIDKHLIFDAERCTGCRICEMACSRAKLGEYDNSRSYIRILKNDEMSVNIGVLDVGCDFCNICVESCLPDAINFVDSETAALFRKAHKIGAFPAPVVGRIIKSGDH